MDTQPAPDIYSMGFDKSLNRGIPDNSTAVVYDAAGDALNAAQVLSGGNLNLKTLSIGGLTRQVAPGDDIQAAINAISLSGGGTVQLLSGTYDMRQDIQFKSNVLLAGAGKDITVLNFMDRGFWITAQSLQNIGLRDLTITRSQKVGSFVTKSGQSYTFSALLFDTCTAFRLDNISVSKNSKNGCIVDGGSGGTVSNCDFNTNTLTGMNVGNVSGVTILNSRANNNNIGFNSVNIPNVIFLSCNASGNAAYGFQIVTSGGNNVLVACRATGNGTGYSFREAVVYTYGCEGSSNTTLDFELNTANYSSLVGNIFGTMSLGNGLTAIGNAYASTNHEKRMLYMQNTSGTDLRPGSVVIFKSVAAGDQVTTTTTNGSNKVFGVVETDSATVSNTYGEVAILGPVSNLFVSNGTASIVIGDWLSTYSHAYYAKKAIAGDTAFAIALATPSTGTASISAMILSPRLI